MSSPKASLFAAVEMAPRDPILGLNEQFNADPNPAKVNLPSTQGQAAPYFANYVKDQLVKNGELLEYAEVFGNGYGTPRPAVEKALEAVGGTGLFRSMGLERLLRDVHGAQFHPLPAKRQHCFTGRVAFGLDPVG